jgi:hypothetical protein
LRDVGFDVHSYKVIHWKYLSKFYSQFLLTIRINFYTFQPQIIRMIEQELFHLLALQQVEGVGDIMAKKLINHCGSAEAVFKTKTSQIAAIDGIGSILLKNLKNKSVFEKAEQELQGGVFSRRKLPRSIEALHRWTRFVVYLGEY